MTEYYSLTLVEGILAVLVEGKVFTIKYQQIEVRPNYRKMLMLNTYIGVFQCLHMPYGILSAPAIFQPVMD